jgi:hypothetical protein
MAGIQTEISRLKHKDIRIRRRAVRHLFDADVPSALPGFTALLKDDDPWFQSKAIEAYRKWASTREDLQILIDNDNEKLASQLLSRVEDQPIAQALFSHEDHSIRCSAAKALSNDDEFHNEMLIDKHHSVRAVVAECSSDTELIKALMLDQHSTVRREAIANAARRGLKIDEETLIVALKSSDPSLRALVAAMTVKTGGDALKTACRDDNPKVIRAISDSLKIEVNSIDERIEMLTLQCPSIILRWLRSRHEPAANSLRWQMIEDQSIDSRTRSKLIEQMEGRTEIDSQRLEIIKEDDSILVKMAAENLSAAVSELKNEDP